MKDQEARKDIASLRRDFDYLKRFDIHQLKHSLEYNEYHDVSVATTTGTKMVKTAYHTFFNAQRVIDRLEKIEQRFEELYALLGVEREEVPSTPASHVLKKKKK